MGGRPSGCHSPFERRGRAAAFAVFLPSLGLLAFALYQRTRSADLTPEFDVPVAPEKLSTVGDVQGWEASVEVAGADRLVIRLEPLHPDPRRQAFDALALARALRPWELSDQAAVHLAVGGDELDPFELPAEPWRLTLTAIALGSDARTVVDELPSVRVAGLQPIVPAAAAPKGPKLLGDVADPIATLLTFPDAALASGESCDLVFWGVRPDLNAPVRVTLPGGVGDLDLVPKVRRGRRTTQSVAFLDGSAPARRPESKPRIAAEGDSREDGGD